MTCSSRPALPANDQEQEPRRPSRRSRSTSTASTMSCWSVAARRRQHRMPTSAPRWRRRFTRNIPDYEPGPRRLGPRRSRSASNLRPSWPGATCRRQPVGSRRGGVRLRGTMTETDARDRLVAHIRAERALWANLVNEIGEDRMTEPGPMGEWTFKDLASHLLAWRERTIARLEAAAEGREEPPQPVAGRARRRGGRPDQRLDPRADARPAAARRPGRRRPLLRAIRERRRRAARGPGDTARCVPVARRQGARRCRAVRPPARRA